LSTEEIIRLLFSFLGGGLVAGILNWIRTNAADKKARRVERLTQQLMNLYGPLYFFTSQNEQMFNLSDQIHEAYTIEYAQPEWSQNEHTQAAVGEEARQTIDLANRYIAVVTDNNEKVIDKISNNYSYIDTDDTEIFQQFIVDYTRFKTEVSEEGITATPFRIYMRLGSISFMRPQFIERVRQKFHTKVRELRGYQAS
jgi:hypothetical protein